MHYDETEKRAHESQMVRAKENLKLSHGGSSHSQASVSHIIRFQYLSPMQAAIVQIYPCIRGGPTAD